MPRFTRGCVFRSIMAFHRECTAPHPLRRRRNNPSWCQPCDRRASLVEVCQSCGAGDATPRLFPKNLVAGALLPPPPPLPTRGAHIEKEDALLPDRQQKGGHGERSYAQVAQKETGAVRLARGDDEDIGWSTVRNRREFHRLPLTNMEGRCYRCLWRGHFARECWDPVVCRLCLRTGHRQKECTNQGELHRQEVGHRSSVMEGMATCFVGEILAGTSTAATILQGLPISDKPQGHPECFQLDSGSFLLQGLPKEIYRELWGITQLTTEGDKIRCRRPLATDGAQTVRHEIAIIEGSPFRPPILDPHGEPRPELRLS